MKVLEDAADDGNTLLPQRVALLARHGFVSRSK